MGHKNNPPRVAAIHDLSCFGRCALSVVTPILSVMGAQVVPLPTALLSTHTGGFDDLYFRDLTPDLTAIISHFERLDLRFDAIYSGFLGSAEQIEIVRGFIDRFGADIPVLVDPVMGDGGSLYKTYTPELTAGMGRLCRMAGIIAPNLTEACFLTGTKFPEAPPADEKEALGLAGSLINKLREAFGTPNIVITGISFADKIGNAYTAGGEDGQTAPPVRIISTPRLTRSFPGTGEVFASTLLGNLLRSGSGASALTPAAFASAVSSAASFTYRVISASQSSPAPSRDGVLLEGCLVELAGGDARETSGGTF